MKGKNPTNLKQHLSKYHADTYIKLLLKENDLKDKNATGNDKTDARQLSLASMLHKSSHSKDSYI